MANNSIFEELMAQNRQLSEGVKPSRKSSKKVTEDVKKINVKKLKFESRRVFEETDFDELDKQFAVDPEDSNEDEVVLVIDPEIPADEEVPEDAAEQMIGDEVYKCPICGANYVCDCDAEHTEGIEVDEDGVPTECPICGDDSEQILIGEIAPAEGAGEETDLDPQEVEEEEDEIEVPEDDVIVDEEEEEVETESLHEAFGSELDDAKVSAYFDGQTKSWKEGTDGRIEVTFKDGSVQSFSKGIFEGCKVTEDEDPVVEIGDPEVSEGGLVLDVAPLQDGDVDELPEVEEPVVGIDAEVVNLNLDDKRFESMMTKMIRENFKFDPSFKITRASAQGNRLKIEYVVRSAKTKGIKGVLVAEGFNRNTRTMSLKFKDKGAFTESFTRTPAIVMECVRIRNCVIPTKMKYDFKKKVNESMYRVAGSVSTKRK